MLSFFKVFGQGILYVIGLPFILAFLGLYAVYCLVMFVYMSFRNLIIFFSGGTPNGDMKEDIEAKRILLARQEKQDAVNDLLLRAYSQQPYSTINQSAVQPQQNVLTTENTHIPPQTDIPLTATSNDQEKHEEEKEVNDDNNINQINRE